MRKVAIVTLSIPITALTLLVFLSVIQINNVQGDCALDNDWPQKPCYDVYPTPSFEQQRKDWEEYYQYKGEVWMEAKKAEMDAAIKSGTLREWVVQGQELEQNSNYNVWWYYYLRDEVPPYGGLIVEKPNEFDVLFIISYIAAAIAIIFGTAIALWKLKVLFRWNNLLFVAAMIAIAYGLFYMLGTYPIVFQYDLPYPFPHLMSVERIKEGESQHGITYNPMDSARVDPYWLLWSSALYVGIVILLIFCVYNMIRLRSSRNN